jgi:hypothetical protein
VLGVFYVLRFLEQPGQSPIVWSPNQKRIQGKLADVISKAHPLYTSDHTGSVLAHVWDLAGPNLPPGVNSGTVDVVVMVFVLSALHPKEWTQAIGNIYRVS